MQLGVGLLQQGRPELSLTVRVNVGKPPWKRNRQSRIKSRCRSKVGDKNVAGAKEEEESWAGARAKAEAGAKSNTVNTRKVVIYQDFYPLAVLPKPKP